MVTNRQKSDAPEKPLTPVMEDYLEALYDLDREKRVVRVKDIAKRMDVKMPTVTSMLKTLSDRGLVRYEKYEYVELTHQGKGVGQEMRRRHGILFHFLTDILKISYETANDEACKMEHALSGGTMDSLTRFVTFLQACPEICDNWFSKVEDPSGHLSKP